MADLSTTNLLLGIMAVVSVLEALVLIGAGVGGFLAYRRVTQLVTDLETRQVEPLRQKVEAILGDVKTVTARVTQQTERVDHAISGTIERVDETAERVKDSVVDKMNNAVGVVRGVRAAIMAVLGSDSRHESRNGASLSCTRIGKVRRGSGNGNTTGGYMAYEYDRLEREDGGGSFLMGLLAGTVLGAGLGMLFAPKAGAELRTQLGEQAGRLRNQATDGYQQASDKVSEKVGQIVDRGREAYDRARTSTGSSTGTSGNMGTSGDFGTTGASGSTGSTGSMTGAGAGTGYSGSRG
jgi:gas vesicle protein